MTQTSLPSYESLYESPTSLNPSQAHGLICGLLCGNPNFNPSFEEVIGHVAGKIQTPDWLEEIYDISSTQLAEFSFEFQLLMPADEAELRDRAEALTLWCQGFLTGLESMHIPLTNRPKNEVDEAIHDLLEITQMNYDDVISNEDDEIAYVELVEYVRMAVIMLYQELRETDSKIQH